MEPRTKKKIVLRTVAIAGFAAVIALPIWKWTRNNQIKIVTGAILYQNADARKQRPIPNATVTAESEETGGRAISDVAGYFRVPLDPPVAAGQSMTLRFRHPDFTPLTMTTSAGNQIIVARLAPAAAAAAVAPAKATLANVRVRYVTKSTNTVSIGSVVRTFDIVNVGNIPCEKRPPCSPDGKWKATIQSISLDTGDDKKQFRNGRVSCIAGPCPFTAVHSDGFSGGGRTITASIQNWSDRVMYLMEAEVIQTMDSDMVRHTYPVTFGNSMSFTLPATAQGPSIEAEVDGSEIVFPLGPSLRLSWAVCTLQIGTADAKLYRCELNPGYRFKESG
jgi:hypothetical protein